MLTNNPEVPEIFQRHIGTWKGEYIKIDTKGHFITSFIGQFTVKIEGINYYQTNEYEYPDGKQLKLEFAGKFDNGILQLGSSSYSDFNAIAWDSGQDTIGFIASKTQDNSLTKFVETITLINPNYRVRSTQQFTNNIFTGINFIAENRVN
jgi:hypothetical protein